jgi:hypothetical protein
MAIPLPPCDAEDWSRDLIDVSTNVSTSEDLIKLFLINEIKKRA